MSDQSSTPATVVPPNGVLPVAALASSVTDKGAVFQVLKNVAVALHRLLDPFCEVVGHDFSDFELSMFRWLISIALPKWTASIPRATPSASRNMGRRPGGV
jgi:hypothetical protein